MSRGKKTDVHTGGATTNWGVRKDKTAVDPNPNGNRAERRKAEREAKKTN